MANSTQKRKGTSNPSIPYPTISEVKSPVVGGELTPNKPTKQRGSGAATKGFTSHGPMA